MDGTVRKKIRTVKTKRLEGRVERRTGNGRSVCFRSSQHSSSCGATKLIVVNSLVLVDISTNVRANIDSMDMAQAVSTHCNQMILQRCIDLTMCHDVAFKKL